MEDAFIITITYNGNTYTFETCIVWTGYQHKIVVNIDDTLVSFEPDEERNYRAVLHSEQTDISKSVTPGLLEAIAGHFQDSMKE
jgi:hypothetical protein